jgi:uncharacterized protein (DUF488 family)
MIDLTCCSIGHSRHSIEQFVGLLAPHSVDLVVDVRSKPYSRFAAQFNSKVIKQNLEQHAIRYEYLGNTLGGLITDPAYLDESGRIDYPKVASSDAFKEGISQICALMQSGHRLAIMCSEREAKECHRYFLITPELVKRGVQVVHLQ